MSDTRIGREPFFLLILIACTLGQATDIQAADEWPGKKGTFHSFAMYDFKIENCDGGCRVVVPKEATKGKPWLWRARFFGHQPQTDIALLEKGYHVAYVDVSNLFGSPKAMERAERLYAYLTEKHGLSKKPALLGMSRGGLFIYNWAAKHPDKVSSIYGDAPVCDFRSWPGGKGQGKGSPRDWKKCLAVYGLNEKEAASCKLNPIDILKPIAEHKIPIIHVVGDADRVVPVEENTAIVEKRYKELGGHIEVIHKPGVDHHPHSLKDPKKIVDFILKHQQPADEAEGT